MRVLRIINTTATAWGLPASRAHQHAGPAGADQGQAGAVVAAGAEKRSEGRISEAGGVLCS